MLEKYSFFTKSILVIFGLILFTFVASVLREVLVPLTFAILLAALLNPVTNWLLNKRVPKILAIALSLLAAYILIAAILSFVSMQLASFSDDMPLIKQKFTQLFTTAQQWLHNSYGMSYQQQQQYIDSGKAEIKTIAGSTLATLFGSLAMTFLLPVYTFLLLYYKPILLEFIFDIFKEKGSDEVGEILNQTKGAIQSYMVGLLVEGLIVATLNAIALLLLGVKYAILLGVIGAILNVLPFIGGILAVILPLVIATATKNGINTQIGITIAYIVIQFVDNHYLVPVIVASKVKINALVSIIIVLLGGMLWGIPGMFLSIPFLGVIKILFDRIPELQPWGRLFGTEEPVKHRKAKE